MLQKLVIIFVLPVGFITAQRPTYAGLSPKGYPELASRFKDPAEEDTGRVDVVNRIGESDEVPQNLPTDARGDASLVNRLNQWPRENRPFWLINSQHVENHRRPESGTKKQQGLQLEARFGAESRTIKPESQLGSFAGTRRP